MRPIDADALITSVAWHDQQGMISTIDDILDIIEAFPTLTPPNEPLTIEQLREMDRFSHPIWDECLHEWCAVRPDVCAGEQGISYLGGGSRPLESGRFYRRPPEGEEDT